MNTPEQSSSDHGRSEHHIRGSQRAGGQIAPRSSHRGRWVSWLAVVVIIAGFVTGGIGLIAGPSWIVVGVGVGVLIAGGVLALVIDVMADVVLDDPRAMPEEPHASPRRGPDYDDIRQQDREEGAHSVHHDPRTEDLRPDR